MEQTKKNETFVWMESGRLMNTRIMKKLLTNGYIKTIFNNNICVIPNDIESLCQQYLSLITQYELDGESKYNISGMDVTVKNLIETVSYPVEYPGLLGKYAQFGTTHKMLLYGPSKCGKTLMATSLAKHCGINLIYIDASQLLEHNTSNISKIFQFALKQSPCLIIFDNLELLVNKENETMITQLKYELTQMPYLSTKHMIFCIGITNKFDNSEIWDSLVSPHSDKFQWIYFIDFPDSTSNKEILEAIFKSYDIVIAVSVDLQNVASKLYGYSCQDLQEICKNAVDLAIESCDKPLNITKDVMDMVLKTFISKAPVSENEYHRYLVSKKDYEIKHDLHHTVSVTLNSTGNQHCLLGDDDYDSDIYD